MEWNKRRGGPTLSSVVYIVYHRLSYTQVADRRRRQWNGRAGSGGRWAVLMCDSTERRQMMRRPLMLQTSWLIIKRLLCSADVAFASGADGQSVTCAPSPTDPTTCTQLHRWWLAGRSLGTIRGQRQYISLIVENRQKPNRKPGYVNTIDLRYNSTKSIEPNRLL